METYTDIQEVATESAKLNPVETEEIRSIKESSFFFKNQAILDRLNENDKGNLTYKDKAIQFEQVKGVVTYTSPDWFYLSSYGNCQLIIDNADAFQEGVKILDIEFLTAVGWLSINSMFRLDGTPYTVFMDRTFFDLGEPALAMIYFPEGTNALFGSIENGDIEQMRVTYIPKGYEVTNE